MTKTILKASTTRQIATGVLTAGLIVFSAASSTFAQNNEAAAIAQAKEQAMKIAEQMVQAEMKKMKAEEAAKAEAAAVAQAKAQAMLIAEQMVEAEMKKMKAKAAAQARAQETSTEAAAIAQARAQAARALAAAQGSGSGSGSSSGSSSGSGDSGATGSLWVKVNTSLNMRAGARGQQGYWTILTTMPNCTKVASKGCSSFDGRAWCNIGVNGTWGWSSANFLMSGNDHC